MTAVVLDASALIALILDEPGADAVDAHIPEALISAVNVTEAATKLIDRGMAEHDAQAAVVALGLEVVAYAEDSAYAAANLRARTRRLGLSLGDRACLALGLARGLPVVTTDRNWATLDIGVDVRLARGH